LVELEISNIPHLSKEESSILDSDFAYKDVFEAIMQMENNKAPGLMDS
jgi:hypothetical protein